VNGKRREDEFKFEALMQMTGHGRPVLEVAQPLCITSHSFDA
jgi:hypothetical protein